jgi:hypothetical protein
MNEVAERPTRLVTMADIEAIEARMKEMPQAEILVQHHYSPGVYARTIFIPKGTRLTGRVHKYENMNILSHGEMSVSTENGFERIKSPRMIVSPPGTKRIAIAHEDCVWTTILHTHLQDPQQIEAHFTCASEQEYLEFHQALLTQGD